MQRAVARINLAAIERNCARLRATLDPGTALCAVVKANGYGHGAVPAARAARAGGASWLAVATALEAAELRAAGLDGPLLVMGALSAEELPVALTAGADVVAWSEPFVAALRDAAPTRPGGIRVHLKLDVGMGRLGTRDADALLALAERALAAPGLELAGATTHLPCADEDAAGTAAQVAAFRAFGERLRALAPDVRLHAANSAATLSLPGSRLDMVRCGVAIYGLDPFGVDPAAHGLEPALELRSYVAAVKPLAPGESVGYGSRFTAREPTVTATLPIGYGDGVRRAFSGNGEVLVRGRRHPLVGRVSMDNLSVEVGAETDVREGDAAILIGADGEERLSAEQLARRIDTINYEITTALTARVVRKYHRDGEEAELRSPAQERPEVARPHQSARPDASRS
jgi:alanine racemase